MCVNWMWHEKNGLHFIDKVATEPLRPLELREPKFDLDEMNIYSGPHIIPLPNMNKIAVWQSIIFGSV